MENIVFIPGVLMAVCVIGCLVLIYKVKGELINPPFLVRIFGLTLFTGAYLSDKGKNYRVWCWRLFLLAFVFALVTVIFMFVFVPEFKQEFTNA